MTRSRGLGFVYQPKYKAATTGEVKTSQIWWISYSVRGDRQRESSESANRADAVRLLKLRTGQAAMGKPVGATVERTTLDDLIAMVEADYIANGRRSLDRVKFAARHLRAFFDGHCKARALTSDRIVAFQAYRREQGAKPSTVNYEVAVLRRGFRLGRNKVPARPDFVMQEVDNVRKGFFEPEQYRAVVEHLPAYLKPVAQVAYITGWRTKSELLTRQWKHVDFEAGWLRLEPGEGKPARAGIFRSPPSCVRCSKLSVNACFSYSARPGGSSHGYLSTPQAKAAAQRPAVQSRIFAGRGQRPAAPPAFPDDSCTTSGVAQ